MINNAAKVEAFRSFYLQAKELYESGDLDGSKPLFIKAATVANDISLSSSSYQTRMDYHAQAEKILKFLKNDFGRIKQTNVSPNKEEKEFTFESVKDDEKKITFDDVAGLDDVKDEITYSVIEPLNNPALAEEYGIKPGAKILMYGPPGTGKTYIAKAIAGEIDAVFYEVNCHDLISKYIGDSSKQIDALFKEAESHKRAIIFFDEFDAVAMSRDNSDGASSELSRFVASFLTKVDGFKKPKECEMLLLIAATNRPWALDSAMLRGGRFDTHIYVGLPDKKARIFLIEKVLGKYDLAPDVSIRNLADRFENYGGADITSACQKILKLAYRRAVRENAHQTITMNDVDTIINNMHVTVHQNELDAFEAFKKGY